MKKDNLKVAIVTDFRRYVYDLFLNHSEINSLQLLDSGPLEKLKLGPLAHFQLN